MIANSECNEIDFPYGKLPDLDSPKWIDPEKIVFSDPGMVKLPRTDEMLEVHEKVKTNKITLANFIKYIIYLLTCAIVIGQAN